MYSPPGLRQAIRLPLPLPVYIRLIEPETLRPSLQSISGQTRNVSAEGLCIETNQCLIESRHAFLESLSGDRLLEVELKLPDHPTKIRLRGRVVWYNTNPPGSTYQFAVGIRLTSLPPREQKIWSEFIHRLELDDIC